MKAFHKKSNTETIFFTANKLSTVEPLKNSPEIPSRLITWEKSQYQILNQCKKVGRKMSVKERIKKMEQAKNDIVLAKANSQMFFMIL